MRTRNVLILILITALLSTSLTYVLAQTPTSTMWISPGPYPGAAEYTFWREGSNYFSKTSLGLLSSGTNFTTLVNTAITALPSGGLLYFTAGQYDVTGEIQVTVNNLTLMGVNAHQSIFYQPDNTNLTRMIKVTGRYVRITNLYLEGNYVNNINTIGIELTHTNADYFTLDHCHVRHFNGTLVRLSTGNGIFQIHNNYITESSTGNALLMSGSADGSVRDNQFGGCANADILRTSTATYIRIIGNKLFGTGRYYMYLDTPRDCVISSNVIGGAAPLGTNFIILLQSYSAAYGHGNIISLNRIYGASQTSDGIRLKGSMVMNNSIVGNLFGNIPAIGVREQDGTENWNNVVGNSFINVTTPLSLQGLNSSALANIGVGVADYP